MDSQAFMKLRDEFNAAETAIMVTAFDFPEDAEAAEKVTEATHNRLMSVVNSIKADELTIGQCMYIAKRSEAMRALLASMTVEGRLNELLRASARHGTPTPIYPDNRDQ